MKNVMPLSNTSQLLLKNIDLLDASQTLLVNAPADMLTQAYLTYYPKCKIDCFNVNYIDHLFIRNLNNPQITCHFSASYQTHVKHDLVVLFFPKSKKEFPFTLAMIAPLLTDNAQILVVGANKGGIKSTTKLSQCYLEHCSKIDSARHCSLYSGIFTKNITPFVLDEWYQNYQIDLNNIHLTISSLPGVFSQKELDVGTKLLLNNLPTNMSGKILDFGCGAGIISAFIGKRYPEVKLALIDVNALALESAKKTLMMNDLTGLVFASDGLSHVKDHYQYVVSNPPFHQGLKTHYAATEMFLTHIKKYISQKGSMTIVANNFLHYQKLMQNNIGKTTELINYKGFCVYRSQLL